jgi:hypothetical protein
MEITGIFLGKPNLTVSVDPWAVDAAVETMIEMGALAVTTK